MTVRGSKSRLMGQLETTLDDNEDFIGSKVFKELEETFNQLDDAAEELEKELKEANETINELEKRIEELEDER